MDEKMKSNGKEEHSHVNLAYIHEEGRSGGGPDTRSSASSSSRGSVRSSMKILSTKLHAQGRTRWVALGVIVLVVVVLIIVITTSVVLTTSGEEDGTFLPITGDDDSTGGGPTNTTSTAPLLSTRKPTTSAPATTRVTTPVYTTTTPYIEDKTTPSNLSVSLSDVLYSPADTTYLNLNCQGRHSGGWNSLTIRRQFKDSYEPVAILANHAGSDVDVHVLYPNLTYYKIVFKYEATLSVTFEVFGCGDLTNFTCALDTQDGVVTSTALVSIFMAEPEIQLPHSIIEDRVVTLSCISETWGHDGSILWKIKPSGATAFMDFSVTPVVKESKHNCTKTINSSITLSPTMYENGSIFRCELQSEWINPQVDQIRSTDTTLFVVPSAYCDDKREFTIHPHPHGPCTLVIYCLNSGPLVYEIECDPGHCYDSRKTACVPQASG